MFVFFMAYYYENSVYGVCIFLLATVIVFIMVYWFEPYKNPVRQVLSAVEEGSLIILFGELLVFLLNPDYYQEVSYIIVTHAILHMLLLLAYPSYSLFVYVKQGNDTENESSDNI